MSTYYNEFNPFAAQWLRNLIDAGLIPAGDVDERDIRDVKPDDLKPYRQHHFFAGIGGWAYALRLAGWPDDKSVFTGSCPCQPFSQAGRKRGFADERHLWPHWFHLIEICQPSVVFGEQVASADVIGKSGRTEMHDLWRREAALRVLEDRIGQQLSECMQGVPERSGAGVAESSAHIHSDPREPSGGGREGAEHGERAPIQSNRGMGSTEAGCGPLRSDGDALLHGDEAGLGHTVSGSGDPGEGIHSREYEAGSVCGKCGMRGLGRKPDEGCCACRLKDADRRVKQAINENRRAIEASDGSAWVNIVQADLERAGYSFGACVAPAAGVGAPHVRQRLYFGARRLAYAGGQGLQERVSQRSVQREAMGAECDSSTSRMADPSECRDRPRNGQSRESVRQEITDRRHGVSSGMADTSCKAGREDTRSTFSDEKTHGRQSELYNRHSGNGENSNDRPTSPLDGFWQDSDWLKCRDGKWRPVEPGTFPLAAGVSNRVGRLCGYGNSIVPQVAAEFIGAFQEIQNEMHP